MEVHDANHQEATTNENGQISRLLSLMIQTTIFCLGDRGLMPSTTVKWLAFMIQNVILLIV